MKHVYLNLKRFDISPARGGVNRVAPAAGWGAAIVTATQDALAAYPKDAAAFTMFFPEAHLLGAAAAMRPAGPIRLGCQGVYREDTAPGGNFGAFTTNRTANAAAELGCQSVLIGHCEERADKTGVLAEAGMADAEAVDRLLNREVLAAQKAGLSVLYCIGEKAEEQHRWQAVLAGQLETGLKDADRSGVVVAYEPVWSIGPGKTPADRAYIAKIAAFVKEIAGGVDVVYGGGLKAGNAEMLASISQIDGGLIALTRFSGEIGFYPDEYLEIVRLYLEKALG
jgi:triosephosphate isomerase